MSVNENGNGNKYASSSLSSSSSPHPEHDEEREYQLHRMEMKKICVTRARARARQEAEDIAAAENRREQRINACDLTGEEFAIVCEELWIDFKSWTNRHDNMRDCISKVRSKVVNNRFAILGVCMFLVWFRWYIGAGREACAKFGVGGIMLSFVCELFRYIGEALVGVFLGVVGFCVGILPLLVCICVYEFQDAFPVPEETEDDDSDDSDDHEKTE